MSSRRQISNTFSVSTIDETVSITIANVFFALSQSGTTVPGDSAFSYDSFPTTLNAGYYVWQGTKITKTDGTTAVTGKMCLGPTTDFLSGTEVYAISTSNSTAPADNQFGTTYNKTKGYYLWTATRVQYTSGTYAYLNKKCVGYWGEDGTSITGANVFYALSTSGTTAPADSSFTYDDFPTTLNSGYYVWEATKVTFSSGSPVFTGKMCLGPTTDFLSGTEVYAISTSNSTAPADNQFGTTYNKTKGYYLWTATRVQYTSGTYAYLNKKCVGYWGEDGDPGAGVNPNILLRTIFDRGINTVKEAWNADWSYVGIDGASDTVIQGRKCIRINASSSSSYQDFKQNVYGRLKASTWYTLSFYYFSTSAWNTFLYPNSDSYRCIDSSEWYIDGVRSTSVPINGQVSWAANWQGNRHTITFKTVSSFPSSYFFIIFRALSGGQVAICMPKLEEGKVATSYVAHEEDLIGNTGERGKLGRFYYYAQEWVNTDQVSYSVTDTEAPYFIYGANYYIFNPEANGTYSMASMGTPGSTSNWKLMVTDFKYLIAEALFGAYAHFGSAIINGDWLLSTNGKIGITDYNNGSSISGTLIGGSSFYAVAYTLFDAQNPLGKDSTVANGTSEVTIAANESTHTLGTAALVAGTTYQLTCKGNRIGSQAIYVRVRNSSYGTGQLIYYPSTTQGEYRAFFRVTTSATYTIEMYQPTTGGGGVTAMWSLDKVVFSPNYAVDLLTGAVIQYEAYMQGFIKKARTIINSSNINKYARKSIFDDMVLDFDKCGNFIELQYQGSVYFALPMLSVYLAPKYTEEQKTQIRSFVGSNMIVYNKTGSNLTVVYKILESSTYATTIGNNGFIELECHTDVDTNSKEVIYWEVVKQGTMV